MIFPLKFSLFSLGGVSLISLCCIPLMTSKGDKQTQKPLEQPQADSPEHDNEDDEDDNDQQEESATGQGAAQTPETTTVTTGTENPTDTTSVSSPVNALSNLASEPQTGLRTSYVQTEDEKAKEIEEGKKEFEQFTKTGQMPTSVNKVRKYFESKG